MKVEKRPCIVISEEGRKLQRGGISTVIEDVLREEFAPGSRSAHSPVTVLIAVTPNAKSSTLGSLSRRVCFASLPGWPVSSATSPKMWKFGMPFARARSSIAGTNFTQNSGFTWRAVSMRKPSTPKRSIQDP